jgi:predicted nucleotide-binding protein
VSYEVLTWDKSFVLNNSSLDCLIENAIKTNYAIFIGTADDNVVANDRERYAREGENSKNRDNVVFEFGLFLGILGKPNCVYMTDKESKVMSDMDGITRIVFDKLDLNESIP